MFRNICKMILRSRLVALRTSVASLTFVIEIGAASYTTLKIFPTQSTFAQSIQPPPCSGSAPTPTYSLPSNNNTATTNSTSSNVVK
jgi:hypothetical protein